MKNIIQMKKEEESVDLYKGGAANSPNSKQKGNSTGHKSQFESKFLEHKCKRDKRKWKPYNSLTYEEKRRLADKEALKDHLKWEVRNNPHMLKSLDYSKKHFNSIQKPSTPHNTSQYLTSNFSQGRNEKVSAVISDFTPCNLIRDIQDDIYLQADDFCIPGGTMKDFLSQFEGGEDNLTNMSNLSNTSNCLTGYGVKEVEQQINNDKSTVEEIRQCKELIEKQKQIINKLKSKLNSNDVEMDDSEII